jgi:predicted CoA-binding protein
MVIPFSRRLRRPGRQRRPLGTVAPKCRACLAASVPDITRDDAAMGRMLEGRPRIAMVGASDNPARDSNRVFRYLVAHGYEVVPVNPVVPAVEGVPTVPDLKAAAAGGPIAIVDVFRAPDAVPPIVEEAIAVGAKGLWLQLGVVNEPAIRRAVAAGLDVVVDRCIKIEHARLL